MGLFGIVHFTWFHPMNRGGRLRAIFRFLRWQLGSRLLPYPVALPFVDQFKLLVERGMTGATGNYYCGLHESEDMAFVLHFLRPGDAFYDIGANVGSYSLLAAAAGVDRIVAFEPSTQTARRLRRNLALNLIEDRVSVQQVALGPASARVAFSVGSDTTNHVLSEQESGEAEQVEVRPFDDFFEAGRPSFVKMDVEGFESQVLAGCGSALEAPHLLGLLLEDNGSGRRYGVSSNIPEQLRKFGFEVFRYDPRRRTIEPATLSGTTGNLLFLKDVAEARNRVGTAPKFKLVNGWI